MPSPQAVAEKTVSGSNPVWLLILTSLPTSDPAGRMRVMRTLDSLGAAILRDGAFMLPDTPENRSAFDALAEYIGKLAGSAEVFRVTPRSEAQGEAFRKLFDRSARYEALAKSVESLRIGFGISDPGAIARLLYKHRHELEAINSLDFFPSEARERARRTLADAEAEVHTLMFPARTTRGGTPIESLRQRTWATCRPLWADKLACAWLIRRFIDPEGSILWLDKAQQCPSTAVGFGFQGAQFANTEESVTFEEMLSRFNMSKNAALVKIGSIVHCLEAEGVPVPEAAGVRTLLQGALRRAETDDAVLHESEKTFDLLYEAYDEAPKTVRPQKSR